MFVEMFVSSSDAGVPFDKYRIIIVRECNVTSNDSVLLS